MKRVASLLMFAVAAFAVAQSTIIVAYGRGTIPVGDNAGNFGLNAAKSESRQFGSTAFAEVRRDGTVVARVAMPAAREVVFRDGALHMVGPGYFVRGDRRVEVRVTVHAMPTTREQKGAYAISCTDANGDVVYGARGELVRGRIDFRRLTEF